MLYFTESPGHAAILHYFGFSLSMCVSVCLFMWMCGISLSAPQMMTLSAACPSNVPAEAAGTVW